MKKILIFLLLCFEIVKAAPDWEILKDKDGVTLYSMQKANFKLKHFKAQTLINKDADTLLAVLQDTQACPQWVYNCVSNDMVDMTDVRKRIYHTVIDSPLWFKDRDFYLQSNVVYDPQEKLFTISLESKPKHSKKLKDKARIEDVEMIWNLKYIKDEETLVTYQVYIDPKLPIKTINHKMIQKSIFQTMQGLTKIVENPIYAKTKYSKSDLEMLIEDR